MSRKSRKNVGVIGLGIIGSRVVTALRAGGFHVYVWNRSPRVMPNFLASPAEVAEVCETIQIFVSDAQALFEVVEGFHEQLTARHTVICSATVGPEATVEAARMVEERGAKFLDAPFTGSKTAAEKRELVYYIGGPEETLTKVEPVLRASSSAIVKIGNIGQAAALKIATNMLAAVVVQTLAEVLAVVKRSGISPETLIDALEHHGVRSSLIEMKLPKMIQGDFEPHFSLKHMFKDVQLAIHVANSLDIDIPATTATAGVMYGGLNRGWADLDYSALAKVYAGEEETAEKPGPDTDAKPAMEKKAGAAPEKPEPPKETLAHMMPPPPREELAAALAEKSKAPAQSSDDEAAPAGAVSNKDSGVTIVGEFTDLPTEGFPGESTAPAVGDRKTRNEEPPEADSNNKDAPRINPIRRWFGARPGNAQK